MDNKNAAAFFYHGKWVFRTIVACAFSATYTSIMLLLAAPAYANAIPGGNIANPVVRAVDIAKPAVVRIITTLGGRLTVVFPNNKTVTFPQNGGTYQVQVSGSGAIISAHGDILTADHVIKPPHDASLNQFIELEAAQDVANYANENINPQGLWISKDALNALNSGYFLSQAYYTTTIAKVYLSTDYTGPIQATYLQNLPLGISAAVDRVEAESPVNQQDLAIIHVKMDDTPSIPLGDSSNVAQQDELTIIGFPGNGDVSTRGDPTDTLTSSINKVYVSALKHTDAGTQVIQVGGNIEHGDSGGPALDSNGHIVGVVSFDQNVSTPEGTGFLQTSNSTNTLIRGLGLDLKPGNLEQEWSQAFTDYTSTAPGHWHRAQAEFQHLSSNYQQFHALEPFLTYTTSQASQEQLPEQKQSQTNLGLVLGIVAICLAIVITVLALVISASRRKRDLTPVSTVFLQLARTMIPKITPMPHSPTYTQPVQLAAASDIPQPPATSWLSAPPSAAIGPVSMFTAVPITPPQQYESDQAPVNTKSVESAIHDETTVKGVTESLRAIKHSENTLDEEPMIN